MITGADISPETEVYTSELSHFIDYPMEMFTINTTQDKKYIQTYKSKPIKRLEGREGRLILRFQYTNKNDSVAVYYFIEHLIRKLEHLNKTDIKSIKEYAVSAAFEQEIEAFNALLSTETDLWDTQMQDIALRSHFSHLINYQHIENKKHQIVSVDSGSLAELIAVAAELSSTQPAIIPIEINENDQYLHVLKSGYCAILSKRQLSKIHNSIDRKKNIITKTLEKLNIHTTSIIPPLSAHVFLNDIEDQKKFTLNTEAYTKNGVICNISYEAILACKILGLSSTKITSLIPDNLSSTSNNKWEDWNSYIFFACFSEILQTSHFSMLIKANHLKIGIERGDERTQHPKRSPKRRQYHQIAKLCEQWAEKNNIEGSIEVYNV
ncbi:hypothetical protein [Maridesulfovibrio sp.]|uniref:hypothetical protein n=1 Tax=Maridesulfovibrio sp. TaxID=2795000 RepID=UPI002A188E4B|nr:hypothetical protein [Maridesulfovibrio sp.]